MTHLIARNSLAEWPVPAFWRREDPLLPALYHQTVDRPGLLGRIVAALLAADARYREARHMERMCDRMRNDIGLPPRGHDAFRLQRLMLEWQRWC